MSKQTDYVNAQFDNAEANIQALFDSISREIIGADVSSNDFASNGYAASTLIYKKGNTVYLVAAFMLNTRYGFGTRHVIPTVYDWGLPPDHYYVEQRMTIDGQEFYRSFEIYTENGTAYWYSYNDGSSGNHYIGPAGPLVIRASWQA